jgi:GNAT superfamily N-acetyltransferase
MARAPGPPLNLNGYTDLPPGTVATIVTYLEMKQRPRLRRAKRPAEWSLERLAGDPGRYRTLFRRVGEPWLWFSRLLLADDALSAIIDDPRVQAYALCRGGSDIGLLELDFRPDGECELSYFGLVPDAIGQGAGRFLMNEAIRRAFKTPITRFFVHTCSLDHPGALPFYLRSGFVPYRRAVEIAPDPRLSGRLPLGAAPQVPVLAAPQPAGAQSRTARPARQRPRRGSSPTAS